jgi:hypothetical protein
LDGGAGRFLFDKLVGGGGGRGAMDVSNDNAAVADVVVGQDHAVRGERVSGRQGFGRNEARSWFSGGRDRAYAENKILKAFTMRKTKS